MALHHAERRAALVHIFEARNHVVLVVDRGESSLRRIHARFVPAASCGAAIDADDDVGFHARGGGFKERVNFFSAVIGDHSDFFWTARQLVCLAW